MTPSRPHILVVDDEPEVRDLVRMVLDDAGFAVTAADDGPAALAAIDREPVDLAVVDLALPGRLDGRETIRRARARHPQLKALFISASERGRVRDDRAHGGHERDEFVYKPFLVREFLGCVFELLLRDGGGTAPQARPETAELGIAKAKLRCLRRRQRSAVDAGEDDTAASIGRDIAETLSAQRRLSGGGSVARLVAHGRG